MGHPHLLLVEGDEDKRVIPEFFERATGMPWVDARRQRLVEIKSADGVAKLLAPSYIQTELKTAGLKALGVMVDADEASDARWRALRDRCLAFCPDFPAQPVPEGFVTALPLNQFAAGIRFGVWLMPDNVSAGMLETFLLSLRPQAAASSLWEHLESSVQQSQQHGATWKQCQLDKVRCHTFLAWQDPPGRQLHQALMEQQLDARSPSGRAFVKWFCDLYQINVPPQPRP